MLRLYHGTNLSSAFDIWLHGIDLEKSLPNLDFGKGFYVTDIKRKAIERAYKKTNDYNKRHKCNEEPYLVELKFYGNQYSFHTEKSLSCIENVSCVIINPIKSERRWNCYEKRR